MKKIKILIPIYNDWQSVFKTTLLIRSIIFLAVYIFLVLQHISAITLNSGSLSYCYDFFSFCSFKT